MVLESSEVSVLGLKQHWVTGTVGRKLSLLLKQKVLLVAMLLCNPPGMLQDRLHTVYPVYKCFRYGPIPEKG